MGGRCISKIALKSQDLSIEELASQVVMVLRMFKILKVIMCEK